jgi:hypothetical protein
MKKRVLLIVLGILILIACCIGGYFIVSNMSANDKPTPGSTSGNAITAVNNTTVNEEQVENVAGIEPAKNATESESSPKTIETSETISDGGFESSEAAVSSLLTYGDRSLEDISGFAFPLPEKYQTGDNYAFSCEKAGSLQPLFVGAKYRDPQILESTCLMSTPKMTRYKMLVDVMKYDITGLQENAGKPEHRETMDVEIALDSTNKILYFHYQTHK